jgi:phage terminase small subunit
MSNPKTEEDWDEDSPLTTSLTPAQKRFVDEYLVDFDPKLAAERAGYKNAMSGYEVINQPAIRKLLANRMKKRWDQADVDGAAIIREIIHLATFDISKAYLSDGRSVKNIHQIPPEVRKAIVGIRHDPETGEVAYKFADKSKYIEMAAKIARVLTDRVEISGTISFEAVLGELHQIRERKRQAKEQIAEGEVVESTPKLDSGT